MASVPNRPYNRRLLNVGTRSGPPQGTEYGGDDFLAGTSYVTGCSGATAQNGPKPGFSYDPPEAAQTVVVEADGTVKRYFVHGNEDPTDSYCRNDGISESKYQSLLDSGNSAAKNYCENAIGGKHYLTDPNCGYVREVSRPLGVDVWDPLPNEPDPEDTPDCLAEGQIVHSSIQIIGTNLGAAYGIGPYSIDSDFGVAAVHAGLINVGDTALIRVRSVGQNKIAVFEGSTRNGVTTYPTDVTVEGIIEELTITDPGQMASTSINVTELNVSGSGADILITLDSQLRVAGYNVYAGGRNYQVGDTFEVKSLGFGPGTETPAILTVSKVRASAVGSGRCGVDLELLEVLGSTPEPCEPEREKRSITVDGTTAGIRGPVNGIRLLNPFADPSKSDESLSQSDDDWNWYLSCPPQNDTLENQETVNSYYFKQISGPSLEEEGKTSFNWTYNWTWYANNTEGCCPAPPDGGGILSVKIVDEGKYLSTSSLGAGYTGNTGEGATFKLDIGERQGELATDRYLRGVQVLTGGEGYKVGDIFSVRGNSFSPSIQESAAFEVTSVTASTTCTESNRINWKVNSVKVVEGGEGYAVGDKFEVVQRSDSPGVDDGYTNTPAIVEVINVEGAIVSQGTMDYFIEKDVLLVYRDTSKDRVIEQVIDIDETSTTDEVLRLSANETLNLFMEKISRLPAEVEFQKYLRRFYSNGGALTDSITDEFEIDFVTELATADQVQSVVSKCDRLIFEDPLPDQPKDENTSTGAGTNCIWDRSTFYQGAAGGTRATNLMLQDLWNFYGQPWGSSGPGVNRELIDGGADVDSISCPRPGDQDAQPPGLVDDAQPDFSDFAGMKVWRWVPCTDGSNGSDSDLGGYVEEFVPCPNLDEGCVNELVSDSLATYDKDAKVTWNDGSSSTGDFVARDENGNYIVSDPIARIINDKYDSLLGRPAKGNGPATGDDATGLNYWHASATNTTSDQWAIYQRGRLKYNDGTQLGHPLVKETITQAAQLINDLYLEIVGRPAEQAGLDYWCRDAQNRGIDAVLVDVTTGLNDENARTGGLDFYRVGIDAVLMDIEDVANAPGQELSRGGVNSFKKFCETQVSGEIDFSWFVDTRPPPWYGTINVTAPVINPQVKSETIYFKNDPTNQTETVSGYSSTGSNATRKSGFENIFNITWPEVTGETLPGQPDPVYIRYFEAVWKRYDDTNGIEFVNPGYPNNQIMRVYDGADPASPAYLTVQTLEGLQPGGLTNNIEQSNYKNRYTYRIENANTVEALTNPRVSLKLTSPPSDLVAGPIDVDDAKIYSFDETPDNKSKYWVVSKAKVYLLDPRDGSVIMVRESAVNQDSSDAGSNKFISQWEGTQECCDGTVIPQSQTCPTCNPCTEGYVWCPSYGQYICANEYCPPVTGTCDPTLVCNQGGTIAVKTNEPTKITFSFRLNNATSCTSAGTAKVSIRRYWPCPTFSPTSPYANSWVEVNGQPIIKKSVPIIDGEAKYELAVNTSKDDYQATSNETQTVDDPGSCHWIYTAYWEWEYPGKSCNQSAWQNPGCDYGDGRNQLPEVLCVQKLNCTAGEGAPSGANESTGTITVDTGKVVNFEFLNPYPDPSKVFLIPNISGYPGAGLGNPAYDPDPNGFNPNVQNWNWYYDCMPTNNPIEDNEGDLIPNESFECVSLTGTGKGFGIYFSFYRWQNVTEPPEGGSLPMTKGCVDSGGDYYQWYIAKRASADPGFIPGDGYAVGDIIEFRAVNQDPDTVPLKIRITEIEVTGKSTDCSKAEWANEFTIFEMDPDLNCLPYCSTSGNQTFYWNGYGNITKPGENCSTGTGIIGSLGLAANQNCNDDCPACEESIKVVIGDTTDCGALAFPGMRESGPGPGINNGRFAVGAADWISVPNFFAKNINIEEADVYTRFTDGKKVVPVALDGWVTIPPVTVAGLTTTGKDNAVKFGEEDFAALKEICCDGTNCVNTGTNWDCQRYCPDGLCYGDLDDIPLVDCNEEVKVVSQWYYKVKYKNDTETGILPAPIWTNYDTPDEEQVYNIPLDYYPASAGNDTNGVDMRYDGESPQGSFYRGFDFTYLPADESIENISIYLQLKVTNDNWGDESYHPPPSGYNEKDFGTDVTVTSQRLPWAIGTGGIPGPKDTIFFIGKYSIGENAKLPTAEWDMVINGCEDAQVHEVLPRYDYSNPDVREVICGDPQYDADGVAQGDNWYRAGWDFGPKEWRQEGSRNGTYFSEGYPSQSSCTRVSFDPKTGAGGGGYESGGAFCPWEFGFNDCIYRSDVKLNVNGPTSIDWGDYNVGGCTTGIKLVWYANNNGDYASPDRFRVISTGYVSGPTGDGGWYRVWNDGSCGDVWEDFSSYFTDPNVTYTVRCYAVVNNLGKVAFDEVNRNWNTQNGDPYNYTDFEEWAITRQSINRFPAEFGSDAVIPENSAWNEGDAFQVVLASAECNVRGGGSTTGKTITGLLDPDVTIIGSGGAGTGPDDFCSQSPCCDPGYATDPSNRCNEILAALVSVCGDRLCVGAGFENGKLTARVNNKDTAWPYLPGTQTRVVGQIKYLWQEKGNDNIWRNVPGGTGETISYVQDGREYRVTVTFDLSNDIPSGYTAKPEQTQKTVVYNSDDNPTQTCPDGSVVPVGTPCPDDKPCAEPNYVNTSVPPGWIDNQGVKVYQIQVNNGENVRINFQPVFEGFTNPKLTFQKAEAVLYTGGITPDAQTPGSVLKIIPLLPSANPNFKQQDIIMFSGSTTETASSTTRNYSVQYKVYFQCLNEPSTFVTHATFNALRVTWGSTSVPYIYSGPECRYASAYQNSLGCGSYVADWYDPVAQKITTYYMLKKDSTSIDDRGPVWSSAISQTNASCTFCPTTSCPTLKITGVTLSPANPKINEQVTAQVRFTFDAKGFNVSNPNTLAQWTGEGVPCQSGQAVCLQEGIQVRLGPYTTNGLKNVKVSVTKYFDDPQQECPISDSFALYGFLVDVYEFQINVGGEQPPAPSEKPIMIGEISGPTELTLANGSVTGRFNMDYQLDDGEGYTPADRDISVKWDGGTAQFLQFAYDRTFTSAGNYTVVARIAKLYAKPGYDGPLDARSILDAGEGFWAYDDADHNISILPEPSTGVPPTASASITGPSKGTLGSDGSVTLSFSATASYQDGTYSPTPEPSRFTYGRDNAFKNDATNVSWTERFTEAGTYDIKVSARKNYCDPGVSFNTSTGQCDSGSKTSAVGRDTLRVTIEGGAPTGTRPTATMSQTINYSPSEFNGCGYGIAGTGTVVSATAVINLTQGTGDFVWDEAVAATGNWTRNGNTLTQTINKSSGFAQTFQGTLGTTVIFKKNGVEVARDGSGQVNYCIVFANIGPISL